MDGFLVAFAISFGIIFVAELGDKSQLMALAFATRYRVWPVLVGITLATSVVHAASVALGHSLGSVLPTDWIALAAALAFVGFGAWTLRGDSLGQHERDRAQRSTHSAVWTVFVVFTLAELGDKTMIATVTLATQHGWFGTWLGSTLGMVAADALAILVGRLLGARLPERTVSICAALLFFGIGGWLFLDATATLTGNSVGGLLAVAADQRNAALVALALCLVAPLLVLVVFPAVRGRRDRTGQDDGDDRERALHRRAARADQWSVVLLGFGVALLPVSAVLLLVLDAPAHVHGGPVTVVVGLLSVATGLALMLAAQWAGGRWQGVRADEVPTAVRPPTTGPFAYVREPMLTGLITAGLGVALLTPSVVSLVALALVVAGAQIRVRFADEPRSARRHGGEYATYTARAGRFLPGLGRCPAVAAEYAHRRRADDATPPATALSGLP